MIKKSSCKKGDNALPGKTSGKNSKTKSQPNGKNVKNTVSVKKVLADKKPSASIENNKPKAKKNVSKEVKQSFIKSENDSNDTKLSELKATKPPSKIAEKISSDLDRKNASYLEPYDDDVLFLTGRHKSVVNDVISCLKSNSPFCFLKSEAAGYHEYYKEVVINHVKGKEKIELLYFDPKFGDDLSAIINKELKGVDISLIGSLNSSFPRKILIIDNENFASDLDWELIDSLRLELKVVNIGVFGVAPAVLDDEVKPPSIASNFKAFYFSEIKKNELKELNEYVSKHSSKTKHLETLSGLVTKGSGKGVNSRKPSSEESAGFWHKFREYIVRK